MNNQNQNQNSYKIYYQIIFALIAILLFLFGYKLAPYVFQSHQNLAANLSHQAQFLFNTPDDKVCFKNSGHCQQVISFYEQQTKLNQQLSVNLDLPNPMVVGEKFRAKVSIKSQNLRNKISSIKLNFEGVEMNMGENSFELSKVSDNEFQGEIIIPMCVTGKMLWRVSAQISFDNQRTGVVNWLFES